MPATCATGKSFGVYDYSKSISQNKCETDCPSECPNDCFTITSNVQYSAGTYCRTCAPTFKISTGGGDFGPVEPLPTGAVKCQQNYCNVSPYQRLAGDNCLCRDDNTISPTLCDGKTTCNPTEYRNFLNECKTLPEFCSEVVDGSGKCLKCTNSKVPNNAGECKDCTIKIVTKAELDDTNFTYPSDRKCLAEPFSASRVIPPYPNDAKDVQWARDWTYLNPNPMNYKTDKTLRWATGVTEKAVNAATIAIAEY